MYSPLSQGRSMPPTSGPKVLWGPQRTWSQTWPIREERASKGRMGAGGWDQARPPVWGGTILKPHLHNTKKNNLKLNHLPELWSLPAAGSTLAELRNDNSAAPNPAGKEREEEGESGRKTETEAWGETGGREREGLTSHGYFFCPSWRQNSRGVAWWCLTLQFC